MNRVLTNAALFGIIGLLSLVSVFLYIKLDGLQYSIVSMNYTLERMRLDLQNK